MIIDKENIMNEKEFGFNSFKHHKKFDCLKLNYDYPLLYIKTNLHLMITVICNLTL